MQMHMRMILGCNSDKRQNLTSEWFWRLATSYHARALYSSREVDSDVLMVVWFPDEQKLSWKVGRRLKVIPLGNRGKSDSERSLF